jgi:hypothetical protein
MTTRVVNVREYKPYSSYWYNQPPDSPYTYVGRAVRYFKNVIMPITSKWHNPYHLKKKDDMTERLEAIRWYREKHLPSSGLLDQLHELKDKLLGCWCKPLPCHGDVLAELVNRLN